MPQRTEDDMLRLTAASAVVECCKNVDNLRLTHSSERLRTYSCVVCNRHHHRALMHDLDAQQRDAVAAHFRVT